MNAGEWLDQVLRPGWVAYAKRLSGIDTGLTGKMEGPYLSKEIFKRFAPDLITDLSKNPRRTIVAQIVSHGIPAIEVDIIYYNEKLRTGRRRAKDEFRITGWGGKKSPLLDPEQTGTLAVFAFKKNRKESKECQVWLCLSEAEEDLVEEQLGSVESRHPVLIDDGVLDSGEAESPVNFDSYPQEWRFGFPEVEALVQYSIRNCRLTNPNDADDRLICRRDFEYRLFRTLEATLILPQVRHGFKSIEAFMGVASTVSNRRKSRSGRSLELHVRQILDEAGLAYSHGGITEGQKRPDFILPSIEAYHDPGFPRDRLRMLAVKTTCKDRWRQILNEADYFKIEWKYLLTLQEGVTENQFEEMTSARVRLVVPKSLHDKYPEKIRGRLLTVTEFVNQTGDGGND